MVDQILHVLLGILLNIPVIGSFIGVNMREYYQRKRTIEQIRRALITPNFKEPTFFEVMDGYDWVKKDLIFSYIGVIIGGGLVFAGVYLLI